MLYIKRSFNSSKAEKEQKTTTNTGKKTQTDFFAMTFFLFCLFTFFSYSTYFVLACNTYKFTSVIHFTLFFVIFVVVSNKKTFFFLQISLSVSQRQCRFVHEADILTSSPVYSFNLCQNECRIRLALKKCNCIPHFYRPTSK